MWTVVFDLRQPNGVCKETPSLVDAYTPTLKGDSAGARNDSVEWIYKVVAHYHFAPLTTCLSVNYLDRFLSQYAFPEGKSWMVQLLSVACLSAAAKMEETDVPLSLDLQVGKSKFVFEMAKIVKLLEGRSYLVEYDALVSDEDENKPLQEEIDFWHARPCPPVVLSDGGFDVYEEVDAFHHDGWWIGVVSKVVGGRRYRVYFRDSKEEIEFEQSQLRVHQEWIDGKWVISTQVLMMMTRPVDVQFNLGSGFCHAVSTSVRHDTPIKSATKSKRRQKLLIVRKKRFLKEATPAMSDPVLSLENETLMPLESRPQTKQKLPNEKYGLSESPFLELEEVTTQTNGPMYGIAIDQITTVPAANPQSFRRKRRLVSHSEVIMDRTAYQDVGSQSIVHKAEVRTDNGSKFCEAKSHKDEIEMSTAAFLPKLKAKLALQVVPNKETNPTLSGDGSFSDDIHFIKVPYLRGSKSVGESESGTVAGYGCKMDLNRLAYHFVLKALYIQGELTWKHELWLTELRGALGISNDDHSKELKCLTSGENVSAT